MCVPAAAQSTGRFDGAALLSKYNRGGGAMSLGGFNPESATPLNHERYQHLLKEYQKQRYALLQPLGQAQQGVGMSISAAHRSGTAGSGDEHYCSPSVRHSRKWG